MGYCQTVWETYDHFNTKKNYTTYNNDNNFWPYRNENIWRLIDNIILIKS